MEDCATGRVDFGFTATDYGRYRAGFPEALFERLHDIGVAAPRHRVLDLGTGTGSLARGLARRGCRVTALDPAQALLVEALRLAMSDGVALRVIRARAERCPARDRSFDVVSAGQCWHWFDTEEVLRECRRMLRPRGWLVLCSFDWLPLPGSVVEATEQLILRHNPGWSLAGGNGVHPEYLSDTAGAGFEDVQPFSFDSCVPYTHDGWRGRIRASAGVGASLAPERVRAFDEELRLLLERSYPEQPMQVPHRTFAVTARQRP